MPGIFYFGNLPQINIQFFTIFSYIFYQYDFLCFGQKPALMIGSYNNVIVRLYNYTIIFLCIMHHFWFLF